MLLIGKVRQGQCHLRSEYDTACTRWYRIPKSECLIPKFVHHSSIVDNNKRTSRLVLHSGGLANPRRLPHRCGAGLKVWRRGRGGSRPQGVCHIISTGRNRFRFYQARRGFLCLWFGFDWHSMIFRLELDLRHCTVAPLEFDFPFRFDLFLRFDRLFFTRHGGFALLLLRFRRCDGAFAAASDRTPTLRLKKAHAKGLSD